MGLFNSKVSVSLLKEFV